MWKIRWWRNLNGSISYQNDYFYSALILPRPKGVKFAWVKHPTWTNAWECIWVGCTAQLFQETAEDGKWTMYVTYSSRIINESAHDVRIIWGKHLTPTFEEVITKANEILMQEWKI